MAGSPSDGHPLVLERIERFAATDPSRAAALRAAYRDEMRRGFTPLMQAIVESAASATDIGVAIDAAIAAKELDAVAEGAMSAVSFACTCGYEAVVARLLDAGADVHVRTMDDVSMLHLAAMHSTALVERLLAAGAEVDFDRHGHTPLDVAVTRGKIDVLERLLASNLRYGVVERAFLTACDLDNIEAMRRLDKPSPEALMRAAAAGSLEAIRFLLDAGVPIDEFDLKEERSPLMHASAGGHVEAAKLLLDRGANPNAMTEWFVTPLSVARAPAMIELLLSRGAKPRDNAPTMHVVMPYATYSNLPARRRSERDQAILDDDVAALAKLDIHITGSMRDCAQAGAVHCIAWLLASGEDPLEHREFKTIENAIAGSHGKIVRMILAATKKPLDRDMVLAACAQADPWILAALIERGAPIDKLYLYGKPLDLATMRKPHAKVLAAHGYRSSDM